MVIEAVLLIFSPGLRAFGPLDGGKVKELAPAIRGPAHRLRRAAERVRTAAQGGKPGAGSHAGGMGEPVGHDAKVAGGEEEKADDAVEERGGLALHFLLHRPGVPMGDPLRLRGGEPEALGEGGGETVVRAGDVRPVGGGRIVGKGIGGVFLAAGVVRRVAVEIGQHIVKLARMPAPGALAEHAGAQRLGDLLRGGGFHPFGAGALVVAIGGVLIVGVIHGGESRGGSVEPHPLQPGAFALDGSAPAVAGSGAALAEDGAGFAIGAALLPHHIEGEGEEIGLGFHQRWLWPQEGHFRQGARAPGPPGPIVDPGAPASPPKSSLPTKVWRSARPGTRGMRQRGQQGTVARSGNPSSSACSARRLMAWNSEQISASFPASSRVTACTRAKRSGRRISTIPAKRAAAPGSWTRTLALSIRAGSAALSHTR